jgi:hypothetical protein
MTMYLIHVGSILLVKMSVVLGNDRLEIALSSFTLLRSFVPCVLVPLLGHVRFVTAHFYQ